LTEKADVVLPAPIWAEQAGHVTNLAGTTCDLTPALPLPAGVRDDADVLQSLAQKL